MKQTIALTGAAGFIGGYIVEEALKKGFKVIGVDNMSKYGEASRSFENDDDYELVIADATDANKLIPIFEKVDHVIAGAAMIGGISYFHKYAYDLLATNERIIASTCDAAIQAKKKGMLKKVTYLSSSMVFESTDRWPSREGDQFLVPPPISSYGFQKLAVEYFARAAWDQYEIPYTILRPFNCVGVGEKQALGDKEIKSGNIRLSMSHVVPDLIQKILKGQKPLQILGSGEQTRCYTYGGDLAEGIVMSLNHPAALNEDFNLSTNETTTVLQLAESIWKKIHGNRLGFEYISVPGFEHDVQKRVPSTLKAKQLLGFEARTPLDEVLDEVISWTTNILRA